MSQKGRVLTLVVRFEQDEYPQWILDAHMKGPQHGVRVTTIAEGDKVQEVNDLNDKHGPRFESEHAFDGKCEGCTSTRVEMDGTCIDCGHFNGIEG